ncbi:MAG: DUF1614 domain-containing protein [Firmicutes bacterium]|nr:DUF1614 domain-containing protein [Bacillota bacterium]
MYGKTKKTDTGFWEGCDAMFTTNIGILALITVTALVYLGLLHRVLDRMRLTKIQALIILLAMLGAGFLPNIPIYGGLSVNIGGALIPAAVAVYLIVTADKAAERRRALLTSGVVAALVYLTDKIFAMEPTSPYFIIDPLFIPAIVAAVTAYILGRSRRSAFIGGIFGVILTDLLAWLENLLLYRLHVPIVLGSTGIYGASVIAGLGAVLLAEAAGEILERLQGGPRK